MSGISNDFDQAFKFIITREHTNPQFSPEYRQDRPFETALKILHNAVREGSREEKKALYSKRHHIKKLNIALKEVPLKDGDLENIKGFRIAPPRSRMEQLIESATLVFRAAFGFFIDLLLVPVGGVTTLLAAANHDFNPKDSDIKVGKTPILMIHGQNFNESEWLLGRAFLRKKQYGSVFSLSYDGLLSNKFDQGIDDYAKGKVREKILEIANKTGKNEVILMGHSMGGLIAAEYAEKIAKEDGITVRHVFTIGSPFHGAPALDLMIKEGKKHPKRHHQMSEKKGHKDFPHFREDLLEKARASERNGDRKYYSLYSTVDPAVPGSRGRVTEDSRREARFTYLGHNSLVASPRVWLKTRRWLDEIYTD